MHHLNKSKVSSDNLVLNETNVYEVFKNTENSSSPPSDVPNAFLKLLGDPLSKILTVIINR